MQRTPAPQNRAYGQFGLPASTRLAPIDYALPLMVFALVMLAGCWLTTQWLAHALGYQPALGTPLWRNALAPVYVPWAALGWANRLEPTASAHATVRITHAALQCAGAIACVCALWMFVRRYRLRKNRMTDLHGSARWATPEDIRETGLLADDGVVAARWIDKGAQRLRWLRSAGPEHILNFAPSGSGKGVGPILSTLLTWRKSAIVNDPKGENFLRSSGWRSSFSRVLRLDFTDDPARGSAFNPLSEVRLGTPYETVDVQRMALQLLAPDGVDNMSDAGRFFATTGAALLSGAMLHVLYRQKLEGRTATFAEVAQELSDPLRTHSQVLTDWLEFHHDPDYGCGWVDTEGQRTRTHPLVSAAARTQRNRDQKDRSPILSTVVGALELFRDPLVAANTSRSDFSIAALQDSPHTLYLVQRLADQDRLKPLASMLFDLWIRRLTESDVTTAPHQLLWLIDELSSLGKLAILETALAAARGWGHKFFLVVQDLEQLFRIYGKHESITSNCAIRTAYAPNKPETARLLSALAGTATVLQETRSESASVGSFFSRRGSTAEQAVRRDLITPDECMRLPAAKKVTAGAETRIVEAGDMLVFVSGFPAIYAKQPLYFQDPTLLKRSQLPPAPPRPHDVEIPEARPLPPPPAPQEQQHAAALDHELLAEADDAPSHDHENEGEYDD